MYCLNFMRYSTNAILGHTFRRHKRSPTLASGFRTVHLQATKNPGMPSRTFCQSLYKTAKSRFMVQCVNVCLALINVHVLKALQRHDNLRMLNTKNERVLPQMRVVCDPPLLLLCSVRRLEQNKWQRSSRAKSRAVEASGEHIEKKEKYGCFYTDVTVYLQMP